MWLSICCIVILTWYDYPMNDTDIRNFKTILESEKALLEKELMTVGRVNPENAGDWQPIATDMNVVNADENEVADTIEEYENNTAILKQLEIRMNEVTKALEKIEAGKYGMCEISGNPIERERLEANPAARTSMAHITEESSLS